MRWRHRLTVYATAEGAQRRPLPISNIVQTIVISISLEWLPRSNSPPSDFEIGKGKAIASLFISGTLLCLWVIHRLRGFLFPKGFFTIGQGVSQFNLLEKIRWGVIIGFFVSFAAGSVIAIL